MSTPELSVDFPFTAADTPALRSRIIGDLARIVERLHAADPHLHALALTGGFSRGEGSAISGAPLNDYDLLAIRDRPGGAPEYRALERSLSNQIGIEVDVRPVWRARLPFVGRSLFWLDVRLGARVVSGEPHALARVRAFDAAAIPRTEIARLLGNRAAGLLLSIPGDDETPDPIQRDLQASKAALAAMDAALLHRRTYSAHMRERLLLARGHVHYPTFEQAVAWKLEPTRSLPRGWWKKARNALLAAVAETHSRSQRDGFIERGAHLGRARRLAFDPSQAVRRRAWELLARSEWPNGPRDVQWDREKKAFFAARARTLQ